MSLSLVLALLLGSIAVAYAVGWFLGNQDREIDVRLEIQAALEEQARRHHDSVEEARHEDVYDWAEQR